MEDVLEVYKRPYDSRRPVVCLDETSKQLIGEVRRPVPAAPGQVAHYDSEYVRHGVANLFMIVEPLAGRRDGNRHVKGTHVGVEFGPTYGILYTLKSHRQRDHCFPGLFFLTDSRNR